MYDENVFSQSQREIDWTDFDALWEDFAAIRIAAMRPGNLTRQAKLCLGVEKMRFVDRKTEREIAAKRKKLRKHSRKEQRSREHTLTQEINWYLRSYKRS